MSYSIALDRGSIRPSAFLWKRFGDARLDCLYKLSRVFSQDNNVILESTGTFMASIRWVDLSTENDCVTNGRKRSRDANTSRTNALQGLVENLFLPLSLGNIKALSIRSFLASKSCYRQPRFCRTRESRGSRLLGHANLTCPNYAMSCLPSQIYVNQPTFH